MSRVVLVEANRDLRAAYAKMLRLDGHTVIAFSTLETASFYFDRSAADVVLLDVRLPDGSAEDLALSCRRRYPQLCIVFITDELEHARLQRAVPLSIVIRKPVDMTVLLEVMNQVCGGAGMN